MFRYSQDQLRVKTVVSLMNGVLVFHTSTLHFSFKAATYFDGRVSTHVVNMLDSTVKRESSLAAYVIPNKLYSALVDFFISSGKSNRLDSDGKLFAEYLAADEKTRFILPSIDFQTSESWNNLQYMIKTESGSYRNTNTSFDDIALKAHMSQVFLITYLSSGSLLIPNTLDIEEMSKAPATDIFLAKKLFEENPSIDSAPQFLIQFGDKIFFTSKYYIQNVRKDTLLSKFTVDFPVYLDTLETPEQFIERYRVFLIRLSSHYEVKDLFIGGLADGRVSVFRAKVYNIPVGRVLDLISNLEEGMADLKEVLLGTEE